MQVFHNPDHARHNPSKFINRGQAKANPEVPERGRIFLDAVTAGGHVVQNPPKFGLALVRRVHDAGYLEYLETAWALWSAQADYAPEIIPNIHPGRNMATKPTDIIGLAGYYQTDTACPIGPATWDAARAAADSALAAADHVLAGRAGEAYALCRPPGHHAYHDMAGGFCFLNNSAIAAQYCRDQGADRVAILDVDVHHGNGTQGIFYDRDDVLTVSLHGDPATFYPYFAGYAEETGRGAGTGLNLNLPQPRGTGDDRFLAALDGAINRVADFKPDILVLALGLDASEADPLAFLAITTDGFAHIAAAVADRRWPTVLVQEGGYISPQLGTNLTRFLGAFETAR